MERYRNKNDYPVEQMRWKQRFAQIKWIKTVAIVLLVQQLYFDCFAQQLTPFYHLTFDDSNNKDAIDSASYQCSYDKIDRGLGKAIDMKNGNCILLTNVLRKNIDNEFSIEFLFKGSSFLFLTFGQQLLMIKFAYSSIYFRTTVVQQNGSRQTHELNILLNGAKKRAYNYYADGEWHHFVFTGSLKSNRMEIWVDGECPDGFSSSIPTGKKFDFGSNDGFRNTDKIDNLAIYKTAIPPTLIQNTYYKMFVNDTRDKSSKPSKLAVPSNSNLNLSTSQFDPKDFAPGYPNYTVQAVDQLAYFPLPRYNINIPLKRNMSWMDISYLHRQLPSAGGKGFGEFNPLKAVTLSDEMVKHWNYYIDIPVLRLPSKEATKEYANENSLTYALIKYANENSQFPVSTILFQSQARPVHAGFNSQFSYVSSQELPSHYYLSDSSGTPIIYNRKKWLSPLMPLDIIEKDGQTNRFYLEQLLKFLNRPPSLINENGEVFGHILPESLLKQDPKVWLNYKESGLTLSQYSGRFQFRMDSVYSNAVVAGLDSTTHFSFYNLSAINPTYWPDYRYRRTLNKWTDDMIYSTPDFYPRWPDNWQNLRGAFNGYGAIAKGRVTEIGMGDKYFSPFISAGWGEEESNIRPAQWLALLKAMVMLGADFFYVGYFNITGAGGKWPNGTGPYDPRGYAYQIAMPAYAQAIRTWVPVFFEKGELLNPADSNDVIHQFRFNTGSENELVMVRKLGKKFLIYGSIQPNSNINGNVPQSKITTIELDGEKIRLQIRRQGSVYILDKSKQNPVFYQLDGWHQYEHPYYWSKIYFVEAEAVDENVEATRFPVITESNSGNRTDFSDCFSYIRLSNGKTFNLRLALRNNTRYTVSAWVRSAGKTSLKLNFEQGKELKLNVSGSEWKIVSSPIFALNSAETLKKCMLTFQVTGASLDIDWIKVTPIE